MPDNDTIEVSCQTCPFYEAQVETGRDCPYARIVREPGSPGPGVWIATDDCPLIHQRVLALLTDMMIEFRRGGAP